MMFLLFWLWLRRRLSTPAEVERRRRRGHPWAFMLAFGTMVTATVNGDLGVALLMMVVAIVLVVV